MTHETDGIQVGVSADSFSTLFRFAVWPSNLVYCALFNTLHQSHYSPEGSRGGISRERFFVYACAFSFCWYFLPGYLFQALSYFS